MSDAKLVIERVWVACWARFFANSVRDANGTFNRRQVLRRLSAIPPRDYLVDGGFSVKDDIVQLQTRGTKVHGVIKNERKQLDAGQDPYAAKQGDAPEMQAFRSRMGTEEGKEKFAQRASIAEFPNAECRNRGLAQFHVRGRLKAKAQTL